MRARAFLGQYRRREIGRESLLAWLDDNGNLDALGNEARQWLAKELWKLLAAPGQASDDETRAAIGDLLVEYSRRQGDAHWLK